MVHYGTLSKMTLGPLPGPCPACPGANCGTATGYIEQMVPTQDN